MVPERKLTPEDVKYVLSSHYQGTPFDPYASYGDKSMKGAYRSIGINRNDFMALIQMRPDAVSYTHLIGAVLFQQLAQTEHALAGRMDVRQDEVNNVLLADAAGDFRLACLLYTSIPAIR